MTTSFTMYSRYAQDGRIYCFEQSNKFNIIDDYKLNEDIVDLKIYQNAIAIGTKEVKYHLFYHLKS
jgi:hypothetical protein